MITFSVALICLMIGYHIYGTIVEKIFAPQRNAKMPCEVKRDDVDYIPLPTWRVYLIQFLNIAGTGPIFGAIMGILYGPAAYLWIVLGCIFAGSVHDYMCGMICVRKGGASLPEIIGDELGTFMRHVMRLFSLILLVMVGAVFVITPASLLDNMIPDSGWLWSSGFWILAILVYYLFATFLPIDKFISKVYPFFGIALLVMAFGIGWNIYTQSGWLPELTDSPFSTHHPQKLPIFPMLCITIACGAISGFHSTQSPLMARCMTNERYGRLIFYGAMIREGVVALVWAAAAIKFASTLPGEEGATAYEKLAAMGNPAIVVKEVCVSWMGRVGAVLAILGVVAAPITSGDTAFRSARLIAADFLHVNQQKILKRLMICLPLFAIATALMFIDFNVMWRYFAWTNQMLACIMLWAASVWLAREKKFFWITLLPAMFMSVVTTSYILVAPEGFRLPLQVGLISGVIFMLVFVFLFFHWKKHNTKQ